jgi:GNAT superfamily N-acetyltransferase
MALPPPRLLDPLKDKRLLPQLVQIHADCITNDHQLATFLPPLDNDNRMSVYWQEIIADVERGRTAVFLQFSSDDEIEVAGYVCLMMPVTQTGPFRGEVNKLMVSPKHRRRGVARRAMGRLEEYALERERYLLVSRFLCCCRRISRNSCPVRTLTSATRFWTLQSVFRQSRCTLDLAMLNGAYSQVME